MKILFFLMSVLLFSGCNYMSRTEMGKRALNRKDYPRAAESFSIALQEDRNSAEAYCLRGYSYYKQGMYEKALKDFSRSDELRDSFSAHYGLALAYLELNEKNKAEKQFSAAINAAPDSPWGYWLRGNFYLWSCNNADEAYNNYKEALLLAPENINIQVAYARSLFCSGRYDECLAFLQNSLKENEKALSLEVELAAFLVFVPDSSLRNPGEAIRILKSAMIILNDDPAPWEVLARAYALQEEFSKAVPAVRKAIKYSSKLENNVWSDMYRNTLSDALNAYSEKRIENDPSHFINRLYILHTATMMPILGLNTAGQ